MASTTRKPPPTTPNPTRRHVAPVAPHGRQSPALSSASTPISARRNSIRDSSIQRGSVNGGSPLSARSAVKTRPSIEEIEQEHENNVILEDIRSRLAKSESAAEAAAEEYAKQIKALQLRLDELHADNVRLEDTTHSKEDTIEGLEMQIKDLTRSRRDQENIYEAEVSKLQPSMRLVDTADEV